MKLQDIQKHWDVEQTDTYAGLPVYRVASKRTEDEKHCATCHCVVTAVPAAQMAMQLEEETRNE